LTVQGAARKDTGASKRTSLPQRPEEEEVEDLKRRRERKKSISIRPIEHYDRVMQATSGVEELSLAVSVQGANKKDTEDTEADRRQTLDSVLAQHSTILKEEGQQVAKRPPERRKSMFESMKDALGTGADASKQAVQRGPAGKKVMRHAVTTTGAALAKGNASEPPVMDMGLKAGWSLVASKAGGIDSPGRVESPKPGDSSGRTKLRKAATEMPHATSDAAPAEEEDDSAFFDVSTQPVIGREAAAGALGATGATDVALNALKARLGNKGFT